MEEHGSCFNFFFSDNIDNTDKILLGHFSELVTDVNNSTVSVQLLILIPEETTHDTPS